MYTLGKIIHKGDTSIIQCAEDYQHKQVVIKRINLEKYEHIEHAHTELCLMLFNHHENICKCYQSLTKDNEIWIVMEKYDCSLRDLIVPNGIQDPIFISTAMYQVLKGLDYLHQNKIVHRDIKGSNILLHQNGHAVLADLGVSKQNLQLTEVNSLVGTPCWMSPEILNGKYNESTDIWSFGITLIECYQGNPPYAKYTPLKAMMLLTCEDPPCPSLNDLNNNTPLHSLINDCLNLKADQRPTSDQLSIYRFWKSRKEISYLTKYISNILK